MTIVRRTSPLGELVSLRQAMDRFIKPRQIRIHPTIAGSASDGSNGSRTLAPGQTTIKTAARAGA